MITYLLTEPLIPSIAVAIACAAWALHTQRTKSPGEPYFLLQALAWVPAAGLGMYALLAGNVLIESGAVGAEWLIGLHLVKVAAWAVVVISAYRYVCQRTADGWAAFR